MFENIFHQTSRSLEPIFCKRAEQINNEHKQQRRRRLPKKSLKNWVRAASNFIAPIPPGSVHEMLANLPGVEF